MEKLKLIILILFLSLYLGCKKKASDEIGYGEIKEGKYFNEYFNMSIQIPDKWDVQSQAAQKELMDQGTSIMVGDDKNLKAIVKASEMQTVNLFAFFKYEPGYPVNL
jgi:hypothetical protein